MPNILVNLAYYTRKERENLHKYVCRIDGIRNTILAICMFIAGLGYSGSQFEVETNTDDLEVRLTEYYTENPEVALTDMVDMAYNKYIEDLIQQFVHVMHNTFRIGGDSPFTNVSIFDRYR